MMWCDVTWLPSELSHQQMISRLACPFFSYGWLFLSVCICVRPSVCLSGYYCWTAQTVWSVCAVCWSHSAMVNIISCSFNTFSIIIIIIIFLSRFGCSSFLLYLWLNWFPSLCLFTNIYSFLFLILNHSHSCSHSCSHSFRWVWLPRTSTCTDLAVQLELVKRAAACSSAHPLRQQVWEREIAPVTSSSAV